MTDNIIEAQNCEDDYQYLQYQHKRRMDYLLLGLQTACALSPLLITVSVWLFTRYVVSVLGHAPQPMVESCQECTSKHQYESLIMLAMFVCLACSVLWLATIGALAARKAGKRMLYPIIVYCAAWMLNSVLWTPEMNQVVEWWID